MSKEMTTEELKKIAVLRGISKEAVIKLQKINLKNLPNVNKANNLIKMVVANKKGIKR